jgi:multidrug efflux pump subunit AcrB
VQQRQWKAKRHPITIISTLPSAGVGALLLLMAVHVDLSVIAIVGIILLIGIVKKNGIMLIENVAVAGRLRETMELAGTEQRRPMMATRLSAFRRPTCGILRAAR